MLQVDTGFGTMFPYYTCSATEDSAAESLDFGVCGPLLSSLGSFTLQNRPGHGASLLPRGDLFRMSLPLSKSFAGGDASAPGDSDPALPGSDVPEKLEEKYRGPGSDVPEKLEETYRGNALAALPIQLDAPRAARTFLIVRPGGEQQQHLRVSALRPSCADPARWSLTPLAVSSHPHHAGANAAPSLLRAPILQLQARAGGPGKGGEYAESACVAARSKGHVDLYTLRGTGPPGDHPTPACPRLSLSVNLNRVFTVHG